MKPRRHILIEPGGKEYLPFLKPLLDRPNSSYQHLQWDPLDHNTYERLFDEGHLPEQGVGKPEGQQQRYGTNDTLLVLANLTHRRSTAALRSNTPLAYMMGQYVKACFNQSLFHRYGLVRIIATLPADDAEVILPRLIKNRKKVSTFAEATGLSLHEVAGGPTPWTQFKEWDMLETSGDQAAKKAQSMGIETPEGREPERVQPAPFPKTDRKDEAPGVLRTKFDWHDELSELEAAFDRGEIDLTKRRTTKKEKQTSSASPEEKEKKDATTKTRKKFQTLRSRLTQENKEFHSALRLVDLQGQVDDLEQSIAIELTKYPEAQNGSVESQMAKLDKLKSELRTCFATAMEPIQRRAHMYTDDRRSYRNGGKDSLLLWERRQYEPLRIYPDEIYPYNPCSVIDFQPDPNAPIITSTTPDQMNDVNEDFEEFPSTYRIFLHLLNHMTNSNTRTIPELVNTMFIGRSLEEIVRAVPSLVTVARATIPSNLSKETSPPTTSTTTTKDTSTSPLPSEKEESSAFPQTPIIKQPPEIETRNPEDPSSYDLSQTRLRTVPPAIFWDLAVEWGRWPFKPESEREVVNMLGGKLSIRET